MSQLKMFRTVTPTEYPAPVNGFTYRRYNHSTEDINAWAEICRNGLIGPDTPAQQVFDACMTNEKGFHPENLFFVFLDGKAVATICVLLYENNVGWVHMVAASPECRGKGVAKLLMDITSACLFEHGCVYSGLSTDDHRIPAIKSYLRAGYKPVLYEDGMDERWSKWLAENGYSDVAAINTDRSLAKILCPSSTEGKVRLGVFGARRGSGIAQGAMLTGKSYIAAVCDADESSYELITPFCREETKFFKDFDEFIESGIDAVVLANYFHQHAEFAIKALEKGIHVLSECLPAVTMAECVALCRASEKSGAYYMLSENCAYTPAVQKLTELYKGGTLGSAIYSEGEYVHPMSHKEYVHYTPDLTHWRALMPSGYYLTHSLAPLMIAIDDIPVAVNARSIYSDDLRQEREGEPIKDVASIMLCTMKKGSLARITGWAKFAGHGLWHRISCSKGSAETVRGMEDGIRLCYTSWNIPEGEVAEKTEKVDFPHNADRAKLCGHAGGDYYVTDEFLTCIQEGRKPYFDVYRSCAMTAVAILGWRSSLHNGAEYKIPDFTNEEERKIYENDNLSPFPDENGNVNYPCTVYDAEKFDI